MAAIPALGVSEMSAAGETAPDAGKVAKPPCEKPPGKKLSEVEKARNEATGRASDVGRQLAFAGIAAVWLLRNDQSVRPFESSLLVALILLAAALLVDFLQYVYCSWVWKDFYADKYAEHNCDDALVDIPDGLSSSTYYFFWTKIVVLFLGYGFLLWAAVKKLQIL